MIIDKVLPAKDRPHSLSTSFEEGPQKRKITRDEVWLASIPPCDEEKNKRTTSIGLASQSLTQQGLQLVSLHALKHAADKGVAFLANLTKGYQAVKETVP